MALAWHVASQAAFFPSRSRSIQRSHKTSFPFSVKLGAPKGHTQRQALHPTHLPFVYERNLHLRLCIDGRIGTYFNAWGFFTVHAGDADEGLMDFSVEAYYGPIGVNPQQIQVLRFGNRL